MIYKTLQNEHYKLEIHYDEDPISPDYWEDDHRFIVYDHRSFTVQKQGFDPAKIHQWDNGRGTYKGYFVFPVYAYIHSGVALSLGRDSYPFTCQWDVSFKGFALVKREKGTYSREAALPKAQGVVDMWNEYLSGEYYGYKFFGKDEGGDWEEQDSCWGFAGQNGLEEIENEHKEYFKEELSCQTQE